MTFYVFLPCYTLEAIVSHQSNGDEELESYFEQLDYKDLSVWPSFNVMFFFNCIRMSLFWNL